MLLTKPVLRPTLVAVALLAAGRLGAQQLARDPLMRDCSPIQVLGAIPDLYGSQWKAVHPATIVASVSHYIDQRQYAQAMARVASVFDSLASLTAPAAPSPTFDRDTALMRSQFAIAIDSLAHTQSIAATRFNVATRIVLGTARVSIFSPPPPNATSIDFDPAPADSARHRAFCWPALAANLILSTATQNSRRAIASRLDTLDARWNDFRSHSYSQFPWELLLNGVSMNRSLEPPSTEFVIVHPSAAVSISNLGRGFSARDIVRRDIIAVEWLGLIARTGTDWSRSLGVSVVSGFSTSPGTSLGVLVHFGTPIVLGVVQEPRASDGRRPYGVLVSADLYRLFDPIRGKSSSP